MNVLITQRPALKCIGMQIETSTAETAVPQLWETFIARMHEIDEIAVPNCSLGICLRDSIREDDDETRFTFLAARVVKNFDILPPDMVSYEIPETLVAVFTHKGSLETLSETYDYIYEQWLPESGYQLADGDELEWYDARYDYDSEDSEMDIHIPVRQVK